MEKNTLDLLNELLKRSRDENEPLLRRICFAELGLALAKDGNYWDNRIPDNWKKAINNPYERKK